MCPNPNHPRWKYQQNRDQIFQEESKKRESLSHLLPSKDDVKKVVGSEVWETKLSTIYSLYQEKEETDAPPSKLKMAKVESKDVADEVDKDVKVRVEKENVAEKGKVVEKWLKGMLTSQVAVYV